MKIIKFICVILIAVGSGTMALAITAYRAQVGFLADTLATTGEVVSLSRHSGTGLRGRTATWYSFRVRFRTITGDVAEGEARETASSPRFAVGETVAVLYSRDRPQDFNIDDFAMLWADVVVFATVAGTFLGAGLSAYWVASGRPKTAGRTEARLPEVVRAWREGRLTRHSEFQPLLIAFAFTGFPLLGGTIVFVLFAPGVVQVIVAALLAWIAFQVICQKRGER